MGEELRDRGFGWMTPLWSEAKPREGMGRLHKHAEGHARHKTNVIAKRRAARKNAKEAHRG